MQLYNMRDSSFWSKRLSAQEDNISRTLCWISEHKDHPNVKRFYKRLTRERFSYIIALYSAGVELERCRAELKELVKENAVYNEKYRDNGFAYYNLLSYTSLGIMLKIDQATVEQIISIYETSEKKSQLIELLLHHLQPTFKVKTPPDNFENTVLFQNMLNGRISPDTEKIHTFLQNVWYSLQKEEEWYDSHIESPDYFDGYWCFEAGAVVVALELDDESLQNTPYYPYRMAHYRYDVSHDVVQSRFPAIPPTQSVPVEKKEKTRSGWFFSFLKN